MEIDYPERLSRWLLWVKWLFVIPAFIVLAFYGIAIFITTFISFWAILFTGRYPSGLFDFARGYMALQARTYAYFPLLLTDGYPLTWREMEGEDVRYDAEEPESLSRGILLLKLVSFIFNVASGLAGLVGFVLVLLAIPVWWIILFTGRYPRGLHDWVVGVNQWIVRVTGWQYLMRDEWILFGRTGAVRWCVGIGAVVLFPLSVFNTYSTVPNMFETQQQFEWEEFEFEWDDE